MPKRKRIPTNSYPKKKKEIKNVLKNKINAMKKKTTKIILV